MKRMNFRTVPQFHREMNYPPPENPLFSILHSETDNAETQLCEETDVQVSMTGNFYSISFKNIVSGEILYGRTKYDCSNGTMLFTAPNQELIFRDIVVSSESYFIAIHEDYILGHEIRNKIRKYGFFNYNVNEALHLSPKEEQIVRSIFMNIEEEYHNNQDEHSKDLILSHLGTLLKYADRFYKRQFINRKELNSALYDRFNSVLLDYFESSMVKSAGIPTVDWIAAELSVTSRYLSDSLKSETGKTALELIHLHLIDEAKELLLQPNNSISEVAYQLGFEYPQYFSRLFKKKVGLSPTEYIEQYSIN